VKERLRRAASSLDPLKLLDQIRAAQHELAELAAGGTISVVPHRDEDLDRFLKSFATAWHDGEIRPTHRSEPRSPRYWPRARIRSRLCGLRYRSGSKEAPDRTAKDLFEQLQDEHPGAFQRGQLRTLQRRVKQWRSAAAKVLVFGGDDRLRRG
jgi:hypothetical protein